MPRMKSSDKNKHICPICGDAVDVAINDSIFCEDFCQAWVHRGCRGLTRKQHSKAKRIKGWSCSCCCLSSQTKLSQDLAKQISELKDRTQKHKVVETPVSNGLQFTCILLVYIPSSNVGNLHFL